MQLRWEQIEGQVATKVTASAATIRDREFSRASSGIATTEAKPLEPIWSVFAASVALFFVAVYASVFFHWHGIALMLPLMLGPVGLAGFGMVVGLIAPLNGSSAVRPVRHRRRVPRGSFQANDTLRTAFDTAELTRAERLYSDVILLLAEEPTKRDKAQFMSVLLHDCNRLLESHARLETQRRRVSGLWDDGRALSRAEADWDNLSGRAEAASDGLTREVLAQSVELCAERIGNLSAIGPALERLEAHQEMICQALALAHASLVRRQAVVPDSLSTASLLRLRDTARRLSGETQAEEAARTEVSRL